MDSGHIHVGVSMGICLKRDGRTDSQYPPPGFTGAGDSESGVYGVCGYLSACACRHVHAGEAAMTQLHTASVCTCVNVSVCAGAEQKLLPPREWGKWL